MEKYILQLGDLTWSKVIMSGFAALAAYAFLYYDDGETVELSIKSLQAQLTAAEQNLADTKQAMADTVKFEKEVSNNEKQFEKVKAYLPADMNANQLTQLLTRSAGEAGALVNSTKPQLNVEKKDFYEVVKLDFTISGRFEQLVTFLSKLSEQPMLLTLEQVEILTTGQAASGEESPKVEMKGSLLGYRYLPDQSIDAAAGGISASQ